MVLISFSHYLAVKRIYLKDELQSVIQEKNRKQDKELLFKMPKMMGDIAGNFSEKTIDVSPCPIHEYDFEPKTCTECSNILNDDENKS
jgi:hypothetical protein